MYLLIFYVLEVLVFSLFSLFLFYFVKPNYNEVKMGWNTQKIGYFYQKIVKTANTFLSGIIIINND